jgi:hypothetical protein
MGEEQAQEGWRRVLRAALRDSVGQDIIFGDLCDQIIPLIPPHSAARVWHSQSGSTQAVVTPQAKARLALRMELQQYRIAMIGHEPHTAWTRETRLRVPPMVCAVCTNEYVGKANTRCCSRSCAKRLGRLKDDATSIKATETTSMNRHPEIAAVEAIYEALHSLPDDGVRQRVLAYVTKLLAANEETPLRVIDQNTAAE